jgi:hypothetical protein
VRSTATMGSGADQGSRPGSRPRDTRARRADETRRLGGITNPKRVRPCEWSPHELILPPGRPGSVSGAPNVPAGFTDRFTSRYIDTGALRLHAVIGGDDPPLLLVHGWPERAVG